MTPENLNGGAISISLAPIELLPAFPKRLGSSEHRLHDVVVSGASGLHAGLRLPVEVRGDRRGQAVLVAEVATATPEEFEQLTLNRPTEVAFSGEQDLARRPHVERSSCPDAGAVADWRDEDLDRPL
ncbi:MAG: hypothetical protein HY725_08425 [Candidatus Rokubacteria bacterium]|nr:hypothetical protein [Candidatus Rokubacteria bacterium]